CGSDPAKTKRVAVVPGFASHFFVESQRETDEEVPLGWRWTRNCHNPYLDHRNRSSIPGEPASAPIPRRQPDRAPPAVGTPCTGTILTSAMLSGHEVCKRDRIMFKAALLGMGILAVVTTTAAAQVYYPYSYPSYNYYSYPGYGYPTYSYPSYSYPYGYAPYYGWPYYQAPAYPYRAAPAYSDPYVGWRPYSDSAGPKASTRGGY